LPQYPPPDRATRRSPGRRHEPASADDTSNESAAGANETRNQTRPQSGPKCRPSRSLSRLVTRAEDARFGLPDDRHIIHGDLVNHNVLVQGSRITAVIDWGNALYGDWLYDAASLIFWWPWFPQWQNIDITAELEGHWEQHGGQPPRLHHRLRACLVHIGLDAMAYNAYRGRWDDLARTASQISELV
jgi:aminoglycoside phosphotransferase (APT) family kinase protein